MQGWLFALARTAGKQYTFSSPTPEALPRLQGGLSQSSAYVSGRESKAVQVLRLQGISILDAPRADQRLALALGPRFTRIDPKYFFSDLENQ